MSWITIDMQHWAHFEETLNQVTSHWTTKKHWLYRGQADASWPLTDSLTRHLGSETPISTALRIERTATRKFMQQAHLFLDPYTLPDSNCDEDWWALMQHFGAPTRLLDWTESPYVALYFAVVDHWNEAGAVWLFEQSQLWEYSSARFDEYYQEMQLFDQELGQSQKADSIYCSENSPEVLLSIEGGQYPNVRLITQQGRFTLPGRILSDHGALIGKHLEAQKQTSKVKLIIDKGAKPDFLHKLFSMNITANSLFPGLDGLGKSIQEYIRMESQLS